MKHDLKAVQEAVELVTGGSEDFKSSETFVVL
jgi:hypothetical protein